MTSEPYDEVKIDPTDIIIRRISSIHHLVWDENENRSRISSKAYSPSSDENGGMSVDIESLILANGLNPRNYVTTPIFTGSVVFLASDIRALNLRVGFDPLPQNPYHGEVWGNIKPNRFSSTQKRGLLSSARWYVALPNVDLQ